MNWKSYFLPAIGASLVAGCAGPLDQRWDDPVYRSLQSRYTNHDRLVADSMDTESDAVMVGIESLQELSVDDAIRIAIDHSPRLRSAGYRIDAASGRVLQAGLYPNPSINFGGEALGPMPAMVARVPMSLNRRLFLAASSIVPVMWRSLIGLRLGRSLLPRSSRWRPE